LVEDAVVAPLRIFLPQQLNKLGLLGTWGLGLRVPGFRVQGLGFRV